MASKWIAAGLLLGLAAWGCGGRSSSKDRSPVKGLILGEGTYASPDGTHDLVVNMTNGLVAWRVVEKKSEATRAKSGHSFSDFQRWFFFWDAKNRLWSYNSDMGPFAVWSRTEDGSFAETVVTADSPLVQEIPAPVRQYLPDLVIRDLKLQPLPNQGRLPE